MTDTKQDRVTKPKRATPAKPKTIVIESWRPAGGEKLPKRGKKAASEPTRKLGIARIATWHLGDFLEAIERLVKEHGQIGEATTSELIHGAESVTDVYIEFPSEMVADMVREKIDGEVLLKRKLQIAFA